MILAVILLIAVALLWIILSYSGFIKLKNSVEEAFSTLDVFLRKRDQLIDNLVETVNGYPSHEGEALEKVTEARNMARTAANIEEKLANENFLSGALQDLIAVSENDSDLKAGQNFMDLQKQLQLVEKDIAQASKFYNAIAKMMNVRVQVFPSNLIAKMFHFTRQPMF